MSINNLIKATFQFSVLYKIQINSYIHAYYYSLLFIIIIIHYYYYSLLFLLLLLLIIINKEKNIKSNI